MSMNCHELRESLLTPNGADRRAEVEAHIGNCPDCARYAARFRQVLRILQDRHAEVEPGPEFVSRVVSQFATQPVEILGWAAWRLIPATLALVAALFWWTVQTTPDPAALLAESPTEDVLTWITGANGADS